MGDAEVFKPVRNIEGSIQYSQKDIVSLDYIKQNVNQYHQNINDKIIVGMIVNVTVGEETTVYSRNYQKSISQKYEQMLYIASLQEIRRNHCATIILPHTTDCTNVLYYFKQWDIPLVGSIVLIKEPTWADGNYLGHEESDIMILSKLVKKSLIPLRPYYFPMRDVPISTVESSNTMNWFFYRNLQIKVQKEYIDQSCGGYMCDRRNSLDGTKKCCCLNKPAQAKCVIDTNIFFFINTNATIEDEDPLFIVENYRSYTFSRLFLDDNKISWQTANILTDSEKHDFRTHLEHKIKLINNNDGWTVLGWYRQGLSSITKKSKEDATEGKLKPVAKQDRIVQEKKIFHISYLLPTKNMSKETIESLKWNLILESELGNLENVPNSTW